MSSTRVVTPIERIEYLVLRRFPFARAVEYPPLLGSRMPQPDNTELRAKIKTYRAELAALSVDALNDCYSNEVRKEVEERRAKAEAEEQWRFFNQAWTNADFAHWSRTADWTLDEAIALSFGKAPEYVSWKKVESLTEISPFAAQYARRRDLVQRAVRWKQLFDPVLPGFFLAWAKRTDISVPEQLTTAIEARGVQVADWKTVYDEAKVKWEENYAALERLYEQSRKGAQDNHAKWLELSQRKDELIQSLKERVATLNARAVEAPPVVPEKSLGTREQESLLKLVIGMAVAGYGYDPKAERSPQIPEIAGDLELAGISMSDDTVRKWLRAAAELLPSK
jgi:hypothetical protein